MEVERGGVMRVIVRDIDCGDIDVIISHNNA